jgi:hypothetical protein
MACSHLITRLKIFFLGGHRLHSLLLFVVALPILFSGLETDYNPAVDKIDRIIITFDACGPNYLIAVSQTERPSILERTNSRRLTVFNLLLNKTSQSVFKLLPQEKIFRHTSLVFHDKIKLVFLLLDLPPPLSNIT